MKTFATAVISLMFIACSPASFAGDSSANTQPKDYVANALPDGDIEIIVTGKAPLPTGTQVAVIDLRAKIEAAAARECRGGYDLTLDKSGSLVVAPNGQGFIAKQRGVARCKAAT